MDPGLVRIQWDASVGKDRKSHPEKPFGSRTLKFS